MFGQEFPVAGLMTLGVAIVFAGWFLFLGVREVRRMRREERRTQANHRYTVPLDGLGPTMADGGEPIAMNGHAGRGRKT